MLDVPIFVAVASCQPRLPSESKPYFSRLELACLEESESESESEYEAYFGKGSEFHDFFNLSTSSLSV